MVNTQVAVEINNSSIVELREISELIQIRKDVLGKSKMREMKIGDKVSFEKKNGVIVKGTIRKKNIKRIVVDTPEGGWNVPANMLTLVEEWDD